MPKKKKAISKNSTNSSTNLDQALQLLIQSNVQINQSLNKMVEKLDNITDWFDHLADSIEVLEWKAISKEDIDKEKEEDKIDLTKAKTQRIKYTYVLRTETIKWSWEYQLTWREFKTEQELKDFVAKSWIQKYKIWRKTYRL